MKLRETDIVSFIKEAIQPYEYVARENNISLTFDHDSVSTKAWIDTENFDKVLINILSNAFKYTVYRLC